jgi:hypothetical protein
MDNLAGRNYMDMCNLLTEVKLNTSFRKFYFPGDGCGIGSLAARKVFGEGIFKHILMIFQRECVYWQKN